MGLLGTILGGVGSLVGGLAGGSAPDPRYKRADLSLEGKRASEGLLGRAQETPEQFGQRNLEGIETDPNRFNASNQGTMARNMSALGMSNAPEQAAAINQKMGQKYASQLAEVGRDARLKGIDQSFKAKEAGQKAQTAMDQINQQQDMIEKQAFEEAEANRNAVFSQVLTGLGGFAVNAGFDVGRMINQSKTPAGQMSSSQKTQQQSINNSPLGGAIQGGLKSIFGG